VSAPSPSSTSSRREGGKGSVVVLKTSKKKMDHERYLDATQRYVPHHLISISYLVLLIFRAGVRVIIKGSHQGIKRLDVWRSFESEPDDGKCQCQWAISIILILVWWVGFGFNICTFSLAAIAATPGTTTTATATATATAGPALQAARVCQQWAGARRAGAWSSRSRRSRRSCSGY
jgi:hypothetical protein